MRLRKDTILKKVLVPIMVILLLQTVAYAMVFLYGGIITQINKNEIKALDKQVENKRIYLENTIINRWMNLDESENVINEKIKTILEANKMSIDDVKIDADLNLNIMEEVYSDLTYVLRKNNVTGAFVILDGPAVSNDNYKSIKSSLYIRDLDPTNYVKGDSDLLLERGAPIIKEKGIALHNNWNTGFEFSEDGNLEEEKFFFKPFRAALSDPEKKTGRSYGYFSSMFTLNEYTTPMITYSIPLIYEDGTVYGVLGIDITEKYIISLLGGNQMTGEEAGSYVIGITTDNGKTVKKVCSSGSGYRQYFEDSKYLTLAKEEFEDVNIYSGENKSSKTILGSAKSFKLYNTNTPFEEEQWVLLGVVDKRDLLSFSEHIKVMILVCTLVVLVIAAIGIIVVSRTITRPIAMLADELKNYSESSALSLSRVNIFEIDKLTEAIEQLSEDVAKSSSKISTILSEANIQIGVFEDTMNQSKVFCSGTLLDMLHWENDGSNFKYIDRDLFEEKMLELDKYLKNKEKRIYQISDKVWYQLILLEQEREQKIGVLVDISKETLDNEKIKYERNYDSLTDIYNRRAFQEKMKSLLKKKNKLGLGALIMWDLDNLKYVNDTYGHEKGDYYIKKFADLLKNLLKYNAVIARRSGDEFFAFLYGYNDKQEIRDIMWEFDSQVKTANLVIDGKNKLRIRASAGIAWYPEDSDNYEELVRFADFAMYNVKHSFKGHIMEFKRQYYDQNEFLLSSSEELNKLIENKLVKFALQPISEVKTGTVYGYEILMRPQLEAFKSPFEVLQVAKAQSKLYQIESLTWFIGMQTFVDKVEEGKISTNQKAFINSIANNKLSEEDIYDFQKLFRPYLSQIVMEVTESEPVKEDYMREKAKWIQEFEAMLAIDDYGSGYNSEIALLYVAPHIVKVDMDIVRGIDRDENRQNILQNLLSYAKKRQIMVLAEGVETREEMEVLISYGVDLLQGYYIAKPQFEIETPNEDAMREMKEFYLKYFL